MAVNIQKLFNYDLPAGFSKNADAAKKVGGKFQINVTGEGGGQWFVNVSDSGPKIEPSNPDGADVVLTLSAEDFQTYLEDPQTKHMQLYFSGKLKVMGNPALAARFPELLALR